MWSREEFTIADVLPQQYAQPYQYLLAHGVGFLQDLVVGTGILPEQVREALRADHHGYALVESSWPARNPITTLYRLRTSFGDELAHRWSVRAADFFHGVSRHPVLATVPAYAAHVGHLGRALAGLILARDQGLLTEVTLPDPWQAGFSPAYLLAEYADLAVTSPDVGRRTGSGRL